MRSDGKGNRRSLRVNFSQFIRRLPHKFIARKLRASFVTAMRGMKCDYHDLQAYCGHKPDNTMAKHYDKPSLERLGKIAGLAQGMVGAEG